MEPQIFIHAEQFRECIFEIMCLTQELKEINKNLKDIKILLK